MNKAMKTGFGKAKRFYQGGLVTPSTSLPVPEKGTGLKKETFKEAFRRARNNKEPDFEYDGETFTTEYKEEKDAREAKEKAQKTAKKPSQSAAKVEKVMDTPAKSERLRDKDFDDISAPQRKIDAEKYITPHRAVLKEKAGPTTRVEPSLTRASNPNLRGGGGGGGTSAASRQLQLGSELDPKELMRRDSSPRGRDKARFNDDVAEFKKGGEVKKRTTAFRGDGCAIRGKTKGRIY
jgi:uncharacterized Zn finger protein (UPF0148 family)